MSRVGGIFSDLFYRTAEVGTSTDAGHAGNTSAANVSGAGKSGKPRNRRIVATYDFRDESGNLLFQEVRTDPKDFYQRQPKEPGNPAAGWINSILNPPVRLTIYRLPELLAADPRLPVFIVEGPGKAEMLARLKNSQKVNFIATSAPGGATKWQESFTESLKGRRCFLIRDNDPPHEKTGMRPGEQHVVAVGNSLHQAGVEVHELVLPTIGTLTEPSLIADKSQKWDIKDWAKQAGRDGLALFTQAYLEARDKPWEIRAVDIEANVAAAATSTGMALAGSCQSQPASGDSIPPANVPPAANASTNPTPTPREAPDDPHRLASLYLARYSHPLGRCIHFWREEFHVWNGRCYTARTTQEIRNELVQCIKDEFNRLNIQEQLSAAPGDEPEALKVTRAITSDVLQAFCGMCSLPENTEQPCWLPVVAASASSDNSSHTDHSDHTSRSPHDFIVLANGILDVQALLSDSADESLPYLLPHTPQFFTPISLNYKFDLSATCPTWLRFVQHNFESDQSRIDMLQEWFGYCLTPDTSQQKFLLMEGEGSNGKSVICSALVALLGHENCSHVPLEAFGQRFALTSTLNKIVNIASEIGEIDKAAEGTLKAYTAGDRMTFDRKNQSLIEATPTARLMLATNNRPRFSDRSDGLWRRMLLLPLLVKIQDHEKVYGMDKPEFWGDPPRGRGELSGIFNWALAGLHRLRQNQRFTEGDVTRQAIAEYKSEVNPTRIFLESFYEASITGEVITEELYRHYKSWCGKDNHRPLSKNVFAKEVRRVFPESQHVRVTVRSMGTINRPMGYRGVQLREDVDPIDRGLPGDAAGSDGGFDDVGTGGVPDGHGMDVSGGLDSSSGFPI